jgi:hypothetical protein
MADPTARQGEEMGGLRGVLHTCSARRWGTPDTLAAIGGRWIRAARSDPGAHPFKSPSN